MGQNLQTATPTSCLHVPPASGLVSSLRMRISISNCRDEHCSSSCGSPTEPLERYHCYRTYNGKDPLPGHVPALGTSEYPDPQYIPYPVVSFFLFDLRNEEAFRCSLWHVRSEVMTVKPRRGSEKQIYFNQDNGRDPATSSRITTITQKPRTQRRQGVASPPWNTSPKARIPYYTRHATN